MLDYHKQKKSQRKKQIRKEILFLFALRISYILLTYTPDTRFKFNKDHPFLAEAHCYLLKVIGKKLNLPVKECKLCKIKFLPDYRAKGHQECCPYGCVELNRRINKEIAKHKYRNSLNGRTLRARGHERYRERKQNGQVNEISRLKDIDIKEVEIKLRNQIKFLYRKLNPGVSSKKIMQLDRILRKLSEKIDTS